MAHLLHRPFLARLRVAAHLGRGERVEAGVVGGMDRDQLALQMGRQLGQRDAGVRERALDLVAIGVALGRALQVEQAAIPARDLHALVAEIRRPPGDVGERIERRLIARELGEKDRRPLDRFHARLPVVTCGRLDAL